MKSKKGIMMKYIFILMVLLLFISCDSSTDPVPEQHGPITVHNTKQTAVIQFDGIEITVPSLWIPREGTIVVVRRGTQVDSVHIQNSLEYLPIIYTR